MSFLSATNMETTLETCDFHTHEVVGQEGRSRRQERDTDATGAVYVCVCMRGRCVPALLRLKCPRPRRQVSGSDLLEITMQALITAGHFVPRPGWCGCAQGGRRLPR